MGDAHDRHANTQVNVLLNLIDEYPGFVILTTNLKGSVDTAFLRRISFKIAFDPPEAAEREALWAMHVPPGVTLARDVDFRKLARDYDTSGGEIRNAMHRAILMSNPGEPLSMKLVRRALTLELETSGNVVQRGTGL